MAGHPSVKKRQKEVARKERQAEKAQKRDERRTRRNDPNFPGEDVAVDESIEGLPSLELPNPAGPGPAPTPPEKPAPPVEAKP